MSDAVIFSLLFLILLVRPTGFFGTLRMEKEGGPRMTGALAGYQSVLDLVLLNCGLALSQFVVLRAGRVLRGDAGARFDRRLHRRHR